MKTSLLSTIFAITLAAQVGFASDDSAPGETPSTTVTSIPEGIAPALDVAALQNFNFKGYVSLKNDAPEPIQLTIYDGVFEQADETDTALLAGQLHLKLGVELVSGLFYTLTPDGQPHLLLGIVLKDGVYSILFMDLVNRDKNMYNISEIKDGKLISRKAGYSDYTLTVSEKKPEAKSSDIKP